jgi:hypothetical protein
MAANRAARIASMLLDAIDYSPDGLNLKEAQKVFCANINFSDYVVALNALRNNGLIEIDAKHIAHRVKG